MIKNLFLSRLITVVATLAIGLIAAHAQDAQDYKTVEVNVTTPGTLGDLVLAQVENFADVSSLKVTGTLNDDDIVNIQRRMTNLRELDMAEVDMPKIPARMLQKCTLIEKVVLPQNIEIIGEYAFSECAALKDIEFPATLRNIERYAFNYCTALEKIILPEGLYKIVDCAFSHCKALEEVKLPSTVVSINDKIFEYCTNLKKVTCMAIEPPYVKTQLIYGEKMDERELIVPAITINTYKQTVGWDLFPKITPTDQLPESITIYENVKIELPESLPVDYKPNLTFIKDYITVNTYGATNFGALDVDGEGTLSLNKFSIIWDPNSSGWPTNKIYSTLINNAHMRADEVEITLLETSGWWTFFSLPFDIKVSDIELEIVDGYPFIIRKYDGKKRAEGANDETWVKMTADSTLHAGYGYIFQAPRSFRNKLYELNTYRFKAINNGQKNNIFRSDDITMTLQKNESEFAHSRGWNLIGNPYPAYYDIRFMDFTSPITVQGRNYIYDVYSPIDDAFVLKPGQAFFVQCPLYDNTITFKKEGRQHTSTVRILDAPMRAPAVDVQRTLLNITLSDGDNIDKTRVVINPDATEAYECDKDASKFMSFSDEVSQIYTTVRGVDYAINERPLGDGNIALNAYIGTSGIYTIALNSNSAGYRVMLEDLFNGRITNLTDADEYTFTAEKGDSPNRFMLHIQPESTAITDIETDTDADEAIYTLEGIRIERPTQKGIYIQRNKKIIVTQSSKNNLVEFGI